MPRKLVVVAVVLIVLTITAGFSYFTKDVDAESMIYDALSTCHSRSDRAGNILCLKRTLEADVSKYGIGIFVEAVGKVLTKGDSSGFSDVTQCHDTLHAIGQTGGINSKKISETIAQCSEVCTYGCFHGVIEGYLMKGTDIAEEIPELCQIDRDDGGKFKSACYHGLGHGVASMAGFDLNKAFALCDLISEEGQRINCGSGVIMELYEPGSFGHALLEWPANIPKFCGSLARPYSEICYTTAGLHEYGRSQSPQKAFRTCESVPGNLSHECEISIGRNFYYVFNGSVDKIIEACENGGKDAFLGCIQGVISSSFAVDPQSQKGYEICSDLGNKWKTKCLEFLN